MLFRTGDQSRDFAVVLATNRPADLDPAVIDRMDESLEFPLPGKDERKQILKLYLDSYIARAGTYSGKDVLNNALYQVTSPVGVGTDIMRLLDIVPCSCIMRLDPSVRFLDIQKLCYFAKLYLNVKLMLARWRWVRRR